MRLGRFALMLLALGACKRQRPDCHFDCRLDPSPRPKPGMRTFRLEGGFGLALEAGDRVDVLTTTSERAATPVQAARVLHAAGHEVWLEVLPEEAELLMFAGGTLALTRRAHDDCGWAEDHDTTINTVLTGERTRTVCNYPRGHITIIKGSSAR